MLVDFNEIFHPTIEEDIEAFKNLIKIHDSQFGRCSTCRHYKCEDVLDPARCDVKDRDLFLQRLLDKNNTGCDRYEYDDELRRNCISEIEKLMEAKEMSPEPKCFKCRYYKKYYNSNKYFCSKGYCVLKNKKGYKQ